MDGLKKSPVQPAARSATGMPPARRIPAAPFGAESGVVGAEPVDSPICNREPGQSLSEAAHSLERDTTGRMVTMAPASVASAAGGAILAAQAAADPVSPGGVASAAGGAILAAQAAADPVSAGGAAAARRGPSPSSRQSAQRGTFVPLLLGGLALLLWFGLQTWLLLDEKANLRATHASQQQTVDRAGKLRQSLDAIAADTQRLADAGNPNARLLVEELRKRGITINPTAATAPPAANVETKK
jgi:hypothetical protein